MTNVHILWCIFLLSHVFLCSSTRWMLDCLIAWLIHWWMIDWWRIRENERHFSVHTFQFRSMLINVFGTKFNKRLIDWFWLETQCAVRGRRSFFWQYADNQLALRRQSLLRTCGIVADEQLTISWHSAENQLANKCSSCRHRREWAPSNSICRSLMDFVPPALKPPAMARRHHADWLSL